MSSLNLFRTAFKNKKVFLPVVHAESTFQVLRNVQIAHESGADGVFIIDHQQHRDHDFLLSCHAMAVRRFPNFWIGVNLLNLGRLAVKYIPKVTAGLWVDNAGIAEDALQPVFEPERFSKHRTDYGWSGIYFGGVAFKYQKEVRDLSLVSRLAAIYVDVVTTSGTGTGEAPDIQKIITMREALGDHPLAIASGVAIDNISLFLPHADCFLVASSITTESFYEFDPLKVSALARAIHQT